MLRMNVNWLDVAEKWGTVPWNVDGGDDNQRNNDGNPLAVALETNRRYLILVARRQKDFHQCRGPVQAIGVKAPITQRESPPTGNERQTSFKLSK